MNPFKAKKELNNKVIRFKHNVWSDIREADEEDKYLVIQNPKNKRVKHVMDSEPEPTNDPKRSNLKSICGHYRILLTSLFALMDTYDECSEIKTRTEIKNDDFMCKKCSKQI